MSETVETCKPLACAACPWRISNIGKPSPIVEGQRYGWYTLANLRRLWEGIRTGDPMTCHPTDVEMIQALGKKPRRDVQTHECAGAVIVVQREMMRLQHVGSVREYRRRHRKGLTAEGIASVLERVIFGGTLARDMGRPDLADLDVQYPPAGLWTLDEQADIKRGIDDKQRASATR
jgi:hypothetical protein